MGCSGFVSVSEFSSLASDLGLDFDEEELEEVTRDTCAYGHHRRPEWHPTCVWPAPQATWLAQIDCFWSTQVFRCLDKEETKKIEFREFLRWWME